jgi:hypothetical protein
LAAVRSWLVLVNGSSIRSAAGAAAWTIRPANKADAQAMSFRDMIRPS